MFLFEQGRALRRNRWRVRCEADPRQADHPPDSRFGHHEIGDLHATVVCDDQVDNRVFRAGAATFGDVAQRARSEEHKYELQSLLRNSYDVYYLTKKRKKE